MNQKVKTPVATKPGTPSTGGEVAEVTKQASAVAVSPSPESFFEENAGAGMEGATVESFAIPFLSVLQKGSPQVDEASGAAIEGARQGMLFENVTGKMIDGKVGVKIIPCAYRRVFLRWAPKGATGSGFKGELLPEEVAQMQADGKVKELDGRLYVPLENGTVDDKKCDRLADTRNHYVLIVEPETGNWTQALISLSSTQIKKSKMLMSALASVKMMGANGMFQIPSYGNVVQVTTVPESNDKGTWFGISFRLDGKNLVPDWQKAAKEFSASVHKGQVNVKYEEPSSESHDSGSDGKF